MIAKNILTSIPIKTGLWLQALEDAPTIPEYYEGQYFTWSLLEGDPTLTVDFVFKDVNIIHINWNGELDPEKIKVTCNAEFTVDDIVSITHIENLIYTELNEIEERKNR
ncbi:MAG: hypothetical protein QXN55_01400 [Candidatus Nitrosotenuis sp.]